MILEGNLFIRLCIKFSNYEVCVKECIFMWWNVFLDVVLKDFVILNFNINGF